MLLTLAACLYISDEELAVALAERAAGGGPPRLDSVTPTAGLSSGGEELILAGHGLGEDVEVRFGDQVAEVTSADAERLYVVAPPADAEGPVEVSVRRGAKVDRLDAGYTYWADGTDLVGAVGSLWYFQRRGGYWAASEVDEASLQFKLVQPAPAYEYWRYWSTALDTCSTNPPSPYTFVPYDLGAVDPDVRAELVAPSREASAGWDATYGGFVNEDFPVAALLTTQPWKLLPLQVQGFPPFETTELMLTPSAWELSAPRIDGDLMLPASVDPLVVRWSGGGATAVVLQVGLIGADGFESEVFCAATDDGEFEVPASFTADWPAGREVHLLVGRYVAPSGTLAFNHARAAVYVLDWRYGAFRSE